MVHDDSVKPHTDRERIYEKCSFSVPFVNFVVTYNTQDQSSFHCALTGWNLTLIEPIISY